MVARLRAGTSQVRTLIGEGSWWEPIEGGLKGIGALALLLALALAASRFRSWREERAVPQPHASIEGRCAPGNVDLNRATPEELEAVPGIGPVLAQEIVRYRERHGPFRRVEELLILRGVSVRKLRALSSFLCVEGGHPAETN